MATQGKDWHACTPWFTEIALKRDPKDFRPINPTVEAALLGINWRKDRGLVDKVARMLRGPSSRQFTYKLYNFHFYY
jgi:hypothetical protein